MKSFSYICHNINDKYMKFTKKQFEEIGPWHFNDLCFDSSNQNFMLKIFNLLPSHLQGLAVSWGCDDSVFRDDVFEFLLENQFGMTYEQYCESEIGNNFFKKGVCQKFDFDKLKPKTIQVDLETGGFGWMNPATADVVTSTAQLFLEKLMKGHGLAKGELGIILAPHGNRKTGPTLEEMIETAKEQIDKNNKDA